MLTAIFIQTTCNVFQQRVNEAFSMYCDDEDREKPFVFNKEQVEGRRFFSPRPREMPERRYLIGECILLFVTTNRNLLILSIIHPKCAVFFLRQRWSIQSFIIIIIIVIFIIFIMMIINKKK